MNKFVKCQTQVDMIKIKEADGKDTFYSCTPEAKAFAQQNLVEGDEVDVILDNKKITKIGKKGTIGTAVSQPQTSQPDVKADGCSAQPVKDYPRSQSYRQPLTPEEGRTIRRQSIMSSTCNAVNACQTQIDPNALGDYIINLYRRLLEEVEK